MEIGVHPDLCVGTVRRALSKVNNTLLNELDSVKEEGPVWIEHCHRLHVPLQFSFIFAN